MEFHPVEENLRQSFRALAAGRDQASLLELPGVTIASLGVRFQMFNAAFFSAPVDGPASLEKRLETARDHFRVGGRAWSLWVCEDWLSWTARRWLSKLCGKFGLRLAAEMPGMVASELRRSLHVPPPLQVRRVTTEADLEMFRNIGAVCFRVPPHWFAEVFDPAVIGSSAFECWLAFLDGEPVATAATVPFGNAIGLYNIATSPAHRGQGIGEAVTRQIAADARRRYGNLPLVLQSTSMGLGVYARLGFRRVTRIQAWVS